MTKNKCIAAVQKREKMEKNGHSSSYDVIAEELDKMAAEGDSIVKQYNGRRSDGAWYTSMYHEGMELFYVFFFEDLIATAQIELNELYHSYQKLPKLVVAKRIAVLLRTNEYLKFLASGLPQLVENANTTSKMENQIDKLRQNIIDFVYSDSIFGDEELMDTIYEEYFEVKPDLHTAHPNKTMELWRKAQEKPVWWQLCERSGGHRAVLLFLKQNKIK